MCHSFLLFLSHQFISFTICHVPLFFFLFSFSSPTTIVYYHLLQFLLLFKHKYKEIRLEKANSDFIVVRYFLAYTHSPQCHKMLQMTFPMAYIGGKKLLETLRDIHTQPLVGRVWKVLEMSREVHTTLHYGRRHEKGPKLSREIQKSLEYSRIVQDILEVS